jgi:hypothetical protein
MKSILLDKQGALFSFHDVIRGEALSVMHNFVTCACHSCGITAEKAPTGEVLNLSPVCFQVVQVCLQTCIKALEEDEDKIPVSLASESISAILLRVGVAALSIPDTASGTPLGDRLLKVVYINSIRFDYFFM